MEKIKGIITKTWSIKDEGHLNKNNIIFQTNKYKKMVDKLKKYDKSLGKKGQMIEKIQNEIQATINTLEKDYGMSYENMYECYLKSSEPTDYHIGISYVGGMQKVLEILKENK